MHSALAKMIERSNVYVTLLDVQQFRLRRYVNEEFHDFRTENSRLLERLHNKLAAEHCFIDAACV